MNFKFQKTESVEADALLEEFTARCVKENIVDLYAEYQNKRLSMLCLGASENSHEVLAMTTIIKSCEQQILIRALKERGWTSRVETRLVKPNK